MVRQFSKRIIDQSENRLRKADQSEERKADQNINWQHIQAGKWANRAHYFQLYFHNIINKIITQIKINHLHHQIYILNFCKF